MAGWRRHTQEEAGAAVAACLFLWSVAWMQTKSRYLTTCSSAIVEAVGPFKCSPRGLIASRPAGWHRERCRSQ
jgi:hypothetical protein